MTGPRKRTPAETWKILEDLANREAPRDAHEIDRVLALSDEEIDRELVDGGVDPAAVRARGEQIVNAPPVEPPQATVAQLPLGRRVGHHARPLWALAAAAAVVVAIGTAKWMEGPPAVGHGHRPDPSTTSVTSAPDAPALARAAERRHSAGAACAASRWRECLDRLDEAAPLDPAGDASPVVQALRAKATAGLAAANARDDASPGAHGASP